jgi:hypothetical protein
MDISILPTITSDLKSESKKIFNLAGPTVIKPLTSFTSSYLLSKLWYSQAPGNFFGFNLSQQLFFSGVIGGVSYFESNLREYVLPQFIKNKLISNNLVDMTSPLVCGLSNVLFNSIFQFYNLGTVYFDRDLVYDFIFGFVSEAIGIYLYNNVIKQLTDQLFV